MANDRATKRNPMKDYDEMFSVATGFPEPYPYQRRLALAPHLPSKLSVPTGLGKTAAIVLAWLWRRRFAASTIRQTTPRRLVFCLPMRVLVEQTYNAVRDWIGNLGTELGTEAVRTHMLLGGAVDRRWDEAPEADVVLVGTQDQLLSRALNRGYAMSRFRWPVQFGLLNNDCWWVMDEVQLMGSGLSTSTQLQALRRILGVAVPVRSTWMSATMREGWLETVDFEAELDSPGALALDSADRGCEAVAQRLNAKKTLSRSPVVRDRNKTVRAEAEAILNAHRANTRSLVVVNTVSRATAIYDALVKATKKGGPELALVHSRFRGPDRRRALDRLLATPSADGTIAISTQVVEAGVDVSAATLWTDLAPWASLVQRFGRCNRSGEIDDARVFWFDECLDGKGAALPYEVDELSAARQRLVDLSEAGPGKLPETTDELAVTSVLRRRDLMELFDTTPDLAGADVDVSRFIRETDERDVQVFWRELENGSPPPDTPRPSRDELCSAPIGMLRKQLKAGARAWTWDHLDKHWQPAGDAIYPGQVLLIPVTAGGYSDLKGYTGRKNDRPSVVEAPAAQANEGIEDDSWSEHRWKQLDAHIDAVVAALETLLERLPDLSAPLCEALRQAARWHDAGKAHPVFQNAMLGEPPEADADVCWAKTSRRNVRYSRAGFRHELASALAMLRRGHSDLAAYLAASHHGKVRVSIRSLPNEEGDPADPRRRFARGVWEGDELRSAELGGGVILPKTRLDLSYMELGESELGPSWLARTLALRDHSSLGPFRLAFLEALLRVADWRGSEIREGEDA